MKAVVDDKIPYIRPALEQLVDEVVYLPGQDIGPADVQDADILLVRTRTRCDRSLLHGSRVCFVGTATIGFDHLDPVYLEGAGITWTNCPGCNATSVAQYVRNSLLLWAKHTRRHLASFTVGIVGVGHVGRAVREALLPWGCRILLNDPPRAAQEGEAAFVGLDEIANRCDVICLHTPLVTGGPHPTFHLVDDSLLRCLKRRPLLLNAGRGEVVDNAALEQALDEGRIAQAVIDTWEGEPKLRRSLLEKVFIGTPHIAGYSTDGKANASRMTLEALARWMGRTPDFQILPPALPQGLERPPTPAGQVLALYNPLEDSRRLKERPDAFEHLRGHYPLRREIWDRGLPGVHKTALSV